MPELEPAQGTPDVTIRIGVVPRDLKEATDKGLYFQAARDEFLFRIEKTAAYYIKNGNEITIELFSDLNNPDVRLFLLGSVFGALLQQRGYLVLHGACVVMNGKGVLLTGKSGVGKSTLAATLNQRGYPLLTDDVSAVTFGDDGTPYVVPGFPSIKLRQNAADRLEISVDGLEPAMFNREKYRVGACYYYHSVTRLNKVYILDVHDKKDVELEPVTGINKLDELIINTYRYLYLNGQGIKSLHFKQCAAVSGRIDVFRVRRPKDGFEIDELADAVERSIFSDAR